MKPVLWLQCIIIGRQTGQKHVYTMKHNSETTFLLQPFLTLGMNCHGNNF